jgi:hypothetical protein
MATFMHIADARAAATIRRSGLLTALARVPMHGTVLDIRAVYCVPVVKSFQSTFQWLRELKRGGYRTAVGVQFRIDDRQGVLLGRYGKPHVRLSAAEAVGRYMNSPDPRGLEVLVPRTIKPGELVRIRQIPQVVGWRYFPEAKGPFR